MPQGNKFGVRGLVYGNIIYKIVNLISKIDNLILKNDNSILKIINLI